VKHDDQWRAGREVGGDKCARRQPAGVGPELADLDKASRRVAERAQRRFAQGMEAGNGRTKAAHE
jgi:hypothetical protein